MKLRHFLPYSSILKQLSFAWLGLCLLGCNGEMLESLDSDGGSVGNFCPTTRQSDGTCPSRSTSTLSWEFIDASDYSYNSNYVEIASGKASLKQVDQTHDSSDFEGGVHVGTYYDSSGKKIKIKDKSHNSFDILSILPSRSSDLISYWKFDHSLEDSSGHIEEGTFGDDATYISQIDSLLGDGALSLDGDGDYVEMSNTTGSFSLGGEEFSISLWFKTDEVSGFMLGHRVVSRGWGVVINASGSICFSLKHAANTNETGNCTELNGLNDGFWHHVVVNAYADSTSTAHELEYYVDGVFSSSNITHTGVFNPALTTDSLCIGSI